MGLDHGSPVTEGTQDEGPGLVGVGETVRLAGWNGEDQPEIVRVPTSWVPVEKGL